jgi:hypothetical protein
MIPQNHPLDSLKTQTIIAVGKTAVVVAPVAFAYVAATRPQLVASAGGWIAEQLGGNRIVGIFAVYLIGIFLVLHFLRPLLWSGRIIGKPVYRLVRYAFTKVIVCTCQPWITLIDAGQAV